MLTKSPLKRLMRLSQIKQHIYFQNYNIDSILDLTCEPVYKVKNTHINTKETIPLIEFMQMNIFEPKISKRRGDDEQYRKYVIEDWLKNFELGALKN